MQHIKWFKDFLDAGLDPYAFESFGKFWEEYKNWLYQCKAVGIENANDIHHAVMVEIEKSIRKIATELYSLFGDSTMTVDHFMCQAASGLYDSMREEYKMTFDKKYKHLCGDAKVQPYNHNKLKCHKKT